MTLSTKSIKLSWIWVAIGFALVAYVMMNILRVGGDDFVFNFNSFIVTPLAVSATLAAFVMWRRVSTSSQDRLLWGGLALGLGLWTLAELYWATAALLGSEVPYPSWADLFWLLGYPALYIALIARGRGLPMVANRRRLLIPILLSLISVGLTTFLIFIPIIRAGDPNNIVESALNIFYPLGDLILLVLVLRLFFSYQHGTHGAAWIWLTIGFIFFAIGDLAFAYANTVNLYYPDGQANLLSTLVVDIPYNLSYLILLIGFLQRLDLEKQIHVTQADVASVDTVPNTHLLAFTGPDDRVTSVSDNFGKLFSGEPFTNKPIAEVLGMPHATAGEMFKGLNSGQMLNEVCVPIRTRRGNEPAWISGIALLDPRGYSGALLLVRMITEEASLDAGLSEYQQSMVDSILEKTGTAQREDEQVRALFGSYFGEVLRAFQDRAISQGGAAMAQAFVAELNAVAKKNGWDMDIRSNSLLGNRVLPMPELRSALPVLVEAARKFTARLTDEITANRILSDARLKFKPAILHNIDCLLAPARVVASKQPA